MINHGLLERNGWQQINANFFWKDGFSLWLWDVWTLEKAPKSSSERPKTIKTGIQTIDELNRLMINATTKQNVSS